jgi:DNA-binding transcriptional ArsR family regulator
MSKIGVGQIKVLSDPNRLAILSLLSTKEMTTTQVSQMLSISVQNTQYHIKKLVEADLISQTRSEIVGNLVEKYYKSAFEPGMISEAADEATIDIAERTELVFAAMGAIKGILNHGISILDERKNDYFLRPDVRPRYPFGANYVILPNTPESAERAEALVAEFDDKIHALAEEFKAERKEKFALLYALFPFD